MNSESKEIKKAEIAWTKWKKRLSDNILQDLTIGEAGLKFGLNRFRDLATIKAQCSLVQEMLGDGHAINTGQQKKISNVLQGIKRDIWNILGSSGRYSWITLLDDISGGLHKEPEKVIRIDVIKEVGLGDLGQAMQFYCQECDDFFQYEPSDWQSMYIRLLRQTAVILAIGAKVIEAEVNLYCR